MSNLINKTLEQLELERQQLRKQLVEMHEMITDLCQQSSHRKLSEVLNIRIQANTKQIEALKTESNEYYAILDGKYPNAIKEQLKRLKQERIVVKRQIGELQRLINTQVTEYSAEDKYLKEQFDIKGETETIRQKNITRTEQLANQVKRIAQLKQLIVALNLKNIHANGNSLEEDTTTQEELAQKLYQLKQKKTKILEQIERKNNLRLSEYNRKIAKLAQFDSLTRDFEQTQEQIDLRIIETNQELERLKIKRKEHKKDRATSFVLPYIQKLDTSVSSVQQYQKNLIGKQPRNILPTKLKTSPLQQEYPEAYKDLFLQVASSEKVMKCKTYKKRSIGDRIRLGFD